jgi:hypothetical protein
MAITFFWLYYDGNSFSLEFEICGNMHLLKVHTRLQGKCDGYNNLTNYNCSKEQFDNLQLYQQTFLMNVNVALACFQK